MEYYFFNDMFFPSKKRLDKVREFLTLPMRGKVMVGKNNYKNEPSRIVALSSLAGSIQGLRFGFDFSKPIGFYDVETDRKGEQFRYGAVNDKVFDDAENMMKELMGYNIRIGHNNYRFDNPVLYHNLHNPSQYFGVYDMGRFRIYYMINGIDVDLLFFLRIMGFEDFKLYRVADELGVSIREVQGFEEDKCLQDNEVLFNVFYKLDIPSVANLLNQIVSVDLHVLQNVFFDRVLRYIIIDEYLKEGYLPVEYPRLISLPNKSIDILKRADKGEYENIYYYDTRNAYPTTAINLGMSVYTGEKCVSNAIKNILLESEKINIEVVSRTAKKLGNAVIGYMNDKTNYFSNPMLWYSVVSKFNNIIKELIKDYTVIWANIDGFMTPYELMPRMNGYEVRLKDFFRWIKIYNPNKYIGISGDGTITLKGMKKQKVKAMITMERQFKDAINKFHNVDDALNSLDISENDAEWMVTVRKTSDLCNNEEFLLEWDELNMGFNDIILDEEKRKNIMDEFRHQFV